MHDRVHTAAARITFRRGSGGGGIPALSNLFGENCFLRLAKRAAVERI